MRRNIAQKLISYRQDHNLTQSDLGAYLGVTAQAVSKWEREQSLPDIELFPALARLLECSLDELFVTLT